ncbi:MAG TPA: response regulator [Verrucomicrobiae bacterium]|nr:response regulator [Verrucomicrobiae bacterium]
MERESDKKTLKILVAEDDPNDAFLLQYAFSRAALRPQLDFVQDGQEAVDYLNGTGQAGARRAPDLLLLDLKMPRLNGFDLLKWLNRQPKLRLVPVIIFSASQEPSDIERAYGLGASSFLVKPPTSEGLDQLIGCFHRYWAEWNRAAEQASHVHAAVDSQHLAGDVTGPVAG